MRLLVRCLVVLGLVMVAFSLHTVLHLDPSTVAMMGAGATVLVSNTTPEEFLEEVEWGTLAFFMALFVLVGALVEVGIIGRIGELAAEAMGDRELLGATALLFGSGVVGAFVDNIPYTTATVPVVEDMVAATATTGADSPLWWAFVFGADLGGNATAVAAGANVVVLGIAAKAGSADQLLGLHQVRHRGHRRHAARRLALRLPPLLRPGLTSRDAKPPSASATMAV